MKVITIIVALSLFVGQTLAQNGKSNQKLKKMNRTAQNEHYTFKLSSGIVMLWITPTIENFKI